MLRKINRRSPTVVAAIAVLLLAAACGRQEETADAGPEPAATPGRAPQAQSTPPETGRPVDSETLPYAEVDEQLVYGHFAFPSDMIEPLPAVIVLHDWWGLNEDVREVSNRLAAEGYMVLAVDLYDGQIFSDTGDARQKMISVVENPGPVENNIRQALEFVGIAGAPNKASLGWGLGGAWSLNASMLFADELDAAVIYYGQVTSDEERLQAVGAPILGLFGARDRGITVDSVTEFDATLQRLRKDHFVHVYPNVGHAFADPARPTFDADVANDAWQKVIDFLGEKLAPAS